MKSKIRFLVTASVIAALYAATTLLCGFFGIAYGPIQFRASEALTILPIFTPAAIPGLAVGCFIANIASFNPIDMVFGTIATLSAASLTYLFRNVRIKGFPWLSFLPPILINAAVIGLEIALFLSDGNGVAIGFALAAAEVGIGEAAVCTVLGVPLYFLTDKHREKIIKE